MCYDVRYLTKRKLDYARRYGESPEEIERLEKELERATPQFYASGFDHPKVPVIINEQPNDFQFYSLGLIPSWAKDSSAAVKLSNQTINARSETMFDKQAFREPARTKRCLVILDGYYEHYHKEGLTFPHHIKLKNDSPFAVAGLWDEWLDHDSGMVRRTVSIVTTKANALIAKIHNNPKLEDGPRMPVILPLALEREWLMTVNDKASRELVMELCKPYDEAEMEAYTVQRLKGKKATGNTEKAIEPFQYPEMNASLDLFGSVEKS